MNSLIPYIIFCIASGVAGGLQANTGRELVINLMLLIMADLIAWKILL